jgi:hypothetical protein
MRHQKVQRIAEANNHGIGFWPKSSRRDQRAKNHDLNDSMELLTVPSPSGSVNRLQEDTSKAVSVHILEADANVAEP